MAVLLECSRAFPDEEGTESPSYILDEIPLSQSKLDDCIFLGLAFCAQSVTSFFRAAPRVLGLARSSAGVLRVRGLGTWRKRRNWVLKRSQLKISVRQRRLLGIPGEVASSVPIVCLFWRKEGCFSVGAMLGAGNDAELALLA